MINKYEKLRKEQFLKLNSVSDIRTLYDEILLEDVINEDEKDKPDGVIFRKVVLKLVLELKLFIKELWEKIILLT
ncbi:MAG: hypothetical protein ACLTAI_01435 [Thomasclavelia sp.]